MWKTSLRLAVGGIAFVLNPYFACSEQSRSDFTYSEEDMQRVVLGTWQGSALIDGEAVPFSLAVEQARSSPAAVATEPGCASRSFVKPAAACIALTRMPVVGTLTSEHPAFNGSLDGEFVAFRTLEDVQLSLQVEGGVILRGTLDDDAVKDGTIAVPLTGSFSLQRP